LQALADTASADTGFNAALDAAETALESLGHALDERERVTRRL
jgi:hypothetical protein